MCTKVTSTGFYTAIDALLLEFDEKTYLSVCACYLCFYCVAAAFLVRHQIVFRWYSNPVKQVIILSVFLRSFAHPINHYWLFVKAA